MAERGQEVPLKLLRPAQRGGLLQGDSGLLPFEREPERVRGVLDQDVRLRRRGPSAPAGEQHAWPTRRRETYREIPLPVSAEQLPRRPALPVPGEHRDRDGGGLSKGLSCRAAAGMLKTAARCATALPRLT